MLGEKQFKYIFRGGVYLAKKLIVIVIYFTVHANGMNISPNFSIA